MPNRFGTIAPRARVPVVMMCANAIIACIASVSTPDVFAWRAFAATALGWGATAVWAARHS